MQISLPILIKVVSMQAAEFLREKPMRAQSIFRDPVEWARFRLATVEEIGKQRGSLLKRVVCYPWNCLKKFLGTVELIQRSTNALSWQQPVLQSLVGRVSLWMGYSPEKQFVKNISSFFLGNRHLLVDSPTVIRAFFKHHRKDEIFDDTRTMRMVFELAKEVFYDERIHENDFIMTCSPEYTQMYRKLLHRLVDRRGVEACLPLIKDIVKSMLDEWYVRCQKRKKINVSLETRLYAAQVITCCLFGEGVASRDISDSIDFINRYIVKSMIKVTDEDRRSLRNAKDILRKTVEAILARNSIPLFDNIEPSLSLVQKKLMIFILFFAGQETTASLLTYILWQLARHSHMQEKIRASIRKKSIYDQQGRVDSIGELIRESMRKFTPAYGVGRRLREDVCLEYRLRGGSQIQKYIFPRHDFLIAWTNSLAALSQRDPVEFPHYDRWFAFGSGHHKCPGEMLAIQEIYELLLQLITDFTVHTDQSGDVPVIGHVTSKLSQDIFISLGKRN